MAVYNTLRSKAHKKYNKAKEAYKACEENIIRYKRGEFGIDPDRMKLFRVNLNHSVELLRQYKSDMSRYNREWNEDEELMRNCRKMRYAQRRIHERYRELYGNK